MSKQTFYHFTLSDGSTTLMTFPDAVIHPDPKVQDRVAQIRQSFRNRRRIKDGFEPGWQPNVNRYAGGRKEYDKILRDEGLVEIGYDYIPKESNPDINPCATEEFALAAKEAGLIDSDREIDAVKSGEFFKD